MGMKVDGPNPPSIYDDFASPLRHLSERGARRTASDRRKPGQRAGSMQSISPRFDIIRVSPAQSVFLGTQVQHWKPS
jgi:hypothetical protein